MLKVAETLILNFNMLNKNQNQDSGENSFNAQSGRDTIININIDIDTIIVQFGDGNKLIESYKTIYNWHKDIGVNMFLENFPASKSNHPYIKAVKELYSPENVSFEYIKAISENINSGPMSWAMMQKTNGTMLGTLAQDILNEVETIQEKAFANIAEEVLLDQVPELKKLDEENTAEKNIGGMVYLTQTLAEFSQDSLATPEYLGLEINEDKESLVNLALEGKIKIIEIKLVHGTTATDHFVKLKIKNNTYKPITFKIPKGQIFENKNHQLGGQNLAVAEERGKEILLPFFEKELTIEAFCANESRGYPNGEGNIAIFKLKDTSFETGKELWKQRKEFLKVFGRTEYISKE